MDTLLKSSCSYRTGSWGECGEDRDVKNGGNNINGGRVTQTRLHRKK